ncbi:hypothetical protein S245_009374 [Arachis hypogaea]|nr:uncharacterized protein DS421_3g88190 [Arachis hypogaea]
MRQCHLLCSPSLSFHLPCRVAALLPSFYSGHHPLTLTIAFLVIALLTSFPLCSASHLSRRFSILPSLSFMFASLFLLFSFVPAIPYSFFRAGLWLLSLLCSLVTDSTGML